MSQHPKKAHSNTQGGTAALAKKVADLTRRVRAAESGAGIITAISGAAIAPDSITTVQIAASTITAGDIAANTITSGQIAADTITANEISANAITTSELAANSVTAAKIVAGTITANEIAAGTITATQIAAATITASQIVSGTITTVLLAAGAVVTNTLAANSVTAAKIAANTITAAQIQAGTITATEIAAGTITATQIQAHSITATQIVAGTITATEIAANTITANKLTVTTLDTITSNMGNISAGTITGGTIQSASSGARWVGDSTGFRGYALDGVTKTFEINIGSGIASFTGIATLDPTSVVPGGALTAVQFGGGNRIRNSYFSQGAGSSAVGIWSTQSGGWTYLTGVTDAVFGTTVAQANTLSTTNAIDYQLAGDYVKPVVVGRKYVLSAFMRSVTANEGTGSVRIIWQDSGGSTLSTVDATSVSLTTSWQRITLISTAPASAAKARIVLRPTTGANRAIQVSAVQFEAGEVSSAYAPAPDEILPSTITGPELAANSVTATTIASGSVTTSKMTANTIDGAVITAGTLDATKIIANTITATQIGVGALTANTIAAGAITATKIGFVSGGKNRALNYTAAVDLTSWSVTVSGFWINSGATQTRITTDGVTEATCVEVVTTASAASEGVTNSHSDMRYRAGQSYVISAWVKSVSGSTTLQVFGGPAATNGTGQSANFTATTSWVRYQTTWVPASDVAPGTAVYVGVRTQSAAVSTFRVASVQIEEGDAITPASRRPGEILAGEVGTTQITDNAITTNKVLAGAITTATMTAGAINGDRITASTLDASKIVANSITSSQITTGTLAGLIIETTSGGVIRTGSSGARCYMDSTGFYVTDASGLETVSMKGGSTNGIIIVAGNQAMSAIDWTNATNAGNKVGNIFIYNVSTSNSLMYLGSNANADGVTTHQTPASNIVINRDSSVTAGNLITANVQNAAKTQAWQATLIDGNGSSSFPGTVTAAAFSANGATTAQYGMGSQDSTGTYVLYSHSSNMYFYRGGTGDVAYVDSAGAYHQISAAATKTDLREEDVLAGLSAIPVYRYQSKLAPNIDRVGPTAEDFYATFRLGSAPTPGAPAMISLSDVAGVALAGAKQVSRRVDTLTARLDAVESSLQALINALTPTKKDKNA